MYKSFSENNVFLSTKRSSIYHSKLNKIKNNRPFSSGNYPCKIINLNKNKGFNSHLILDNINTFSYTNKFISLKKNFSYTLKNKKKKLKLKMDDYLMYNIKSKSPIELLVEKKENEFNIKLSNKKLLSFQKIISNFIKKNFKHIRKNPFRDNYYFYKSKLNYNTKSSKNKINNQENALNFDNCKYKIFKTISKKIENQIILNDKKLSIKDWLEKIKREKNVMNKARISELKNDIEDNKILFTPKNFMKFRKDTFSYYKLNQLIKQLTPEISYKNRFILADNLGFSLDEDMIQNNKKTIKKENKV